MPLDARRLRLGFLAAALILAAIVVGAWFYGRWRIRTAMQRIPEKLGIEVQQSTQGFTLSKSEGGRTLFTIHASHTVQYRQGGRAELRDVNIIVYGRSGNRFDQIYGSSFQYDPQAAEVRAVGEVSIDLAAAQGNAGPPQSRPPEELKTAVHLKTSNLAFSHKTGLAHTAERIEFRTPQVSGSARGATYDSHSNQLTLESEVSLTALQARPQPGASPATLRARQATFTKEPLEATLSQVEGERGAERYAADTLRLAFRPDGTVERVLAQGGLRAERSGAAPASFHALRAELFVTPRNALHHAALSGNVMFDVAGARGFHGQAQRVLVDFGPENRVRHLRALDNVALTQQPAPAQSSARAAPRPAAQTVQLTAQEAVDLDVQDGRRLLRAATSGPAQIVITQAAGAAAALGSRAVVTAGRFDATFDRENHLQALHGAPDAKVVSSAPGQPDRITSSRDLSATFAPGGTEINALTQQGDFRYSEGTRRATAERARYSARDDTLELTGSPRYSDTGLALAAGLLRLHRTTGLLEAQGEVKTTYVEMQAQPSGALLASSSPVHVTAAAMSARQASGAARYTGGARLWQEASIVSAPTLEFDRDRRSLLATGTPQQSVSTVFVQQDKSGKPTPVNITAARLVYSDLDRRASFTGGVLLRGADATITAGRLDVLLKPRGSRPGGSAAASGPAELDQAVAEGGIVLEQSGRKATGDRLVYTAADGRFVLTGGPPSIFDAEQGKITGDSLTFFSRDDRVLVESKDRSTAVTHTRVKR